MRRARTSSPSRCERPALRIGRVDSMKVYMRPAVDFCAKDRVVVVWTTSYYLRKFHAVLFLGRSSFYTQHQRPQKKGGDNPYVWSNSLLSATFCFPLSSPSADSHQAYRSWCHRARSDDSRIGQRTGRLAPKCECLECLECPFAGFTRTFTSPSNDRGPFLF